MKCLVKVTAIDTLEEVPGVWTNKDYVEMLDLLGFPDAETAAPDELKDLLFMAINDFEPEEAAEVILSYKLADVLSEGQIKQLSHEMQEDKVAEDYADIALHFPLYNINQLLYKAFNGKFPNTKASRVKLELQLHQNDDLAMDKELVLKAISSGLRDQNLIKRLFEKQLAGEAEFPDAENIIWELATSENGEVSFITSDYWLNKEDFLAFEYEGKIVELEHEEE